MRKLKWVAVAAAVLLAGTASAGFDQGFETDTSGCDVFGGILDAVRVPSGNNGIPSAAGQWHAIVTNIGFGAACDWGGYGCIPGCSAPSCAAGTTFPPLGYMTSVDVYLAPEARLTNDTAFDFLSAVNQIPQTTTYQYVFNAGFYDDDDGSPGSGTNRFIVSASTLPQVNGAFPKDPTKSPIAITQTGWYTFRHDFYDTGGGVLAVDMSISRANGPLVRRWTISDPALVIGVRIGGNASGWFVLNEVPNLAFDNVRQTGCTPSACCTHDPADDTSCVIDRRDFCEASGGSYLGDGATCDNAEIECRPLLAELDTVSVTRTQQGVRIEWTTLTEIDTAGFRILCGAGRHDKSLELVAPFVPAAGTNLTGASYEFLDTARRSGGGTYYIEDIDTFGRVTRHGPFAVNRGRGSRGPR